MIRARSTPIVIRASKRARFTWDDVPTVEIAPRVKRKIVHLKNVMLVYYEVGAGVGLLIHQHPHEQIGAILQGQRELIIGDGKRVLCAGEGYVVLSNVKHVDKESARNRMSS